MAYLERYPDVRRDPALLLPGARTIMVCAFPYYDSDECAGLKLARYARGDDYHEVLRSRLQPVAELLGSMGHQQRICVDTAPIFERHWAVKAGVGFMGRNRLLIVPGWGSYVFWLKYLLIWKSRPTSRWSGSATAAAVVWQPVPEALCVLPRVSTRAAAFRILPLSIVESSLPR